MKPIHFLVEVLLNCFKGPDCFSTYGILDSFSLSGIVGFVSQENVQRMSAGYAAHSRALETNFHGKKERDKISFKRTLNGPAV